MSPFHAILKIIEGEKYRCRIVALCKINNSSYPMTNDTMHIQKMFLIFFKFYYE